VEVAVPAAAAVAERAAAAVPAVVEKPAGAEPEESARDSSSGAW
jgi:hypothetical protein